jgi:hypothetical protein
VTGLVIAFSRVSFSLKYRRREKEEWLTLEVSAFWGLFKYRVAEPSMRLGAEDGTAGVELEAKAGMKPMAEVSYFASFPLILRLLWDWRRIIKRHWTAFAYLWRRLQVTRFEWHTVVGTGEPSTTGIMCGLLWGAAEVCLGRCSPRLTSPVSVSVKPDFFAPVFGTSLNLAASFQVRHFMGAGVRFIDSLRKNWPRTLS